MEHHHVIHRELRKTPGHPGRGIFANIFIINKLHFTLPLTYSRSGYVSVTYSKDHFAPLLTVTVFVRIGHVYASAGDKNPELDTLKFKDTERRLAEGWEADRCGRPSLSEIGSSTVYCL